MHKKILEDSLTKKDICQFFKINIDNVLNSKNWSTADPIEEWICIFYGSVLKEGDLQGGVYARILHTNDFFA